MSKYVGNIVGLTFKKQIFQEEDIYETQDIPARLLRNIFVQKGITYGDLFEALKTEALKMGMSSKKINEKWGNLKPTVKSKNITYKMLSYIFALFKWRISNIAFTIECENESGEKEESDYSIKL